MKQDTTVNRIPTTTRATKVLAKSFLSSKYVVLVGLFALFPNPLPLAATIYYGNVYAGATADSSGRVFGWGVTDVTYYDTIHTGMVSTTLRSPKGRIASASNQHVDVARADVSLPFDANDLGNYTLDNVHNATCTYMGYIIYMEHTGFPIGIAIADTNYIFTDIDPLGCAYYLYCPNGNASVTCPAQNPVYVNPALNVCKNYLHDHRLKVTFLGAKLCFPVGVAELANFAINCS